MSMNTTEMLIILLHFNGYCNVLQFQTCKNNISLHFIIEDKYKAETVGMFCKESFKSLHCTETSSQEFEYDSSVISLVSG